MRACEVISKDSPISRKYGKNKTSSHSIFSTFGFVINSIFHHLFSQTKLFEIISYVLFASSNTKVLPIQS